MQTVCSSTNDASPNSSPTRLRRNCSRTTCASAPTTRAVRSIRNSIAWRSLPSGLSGSGHVERAPRELVEHRDAQRLGGDRAGVDRDAAEPLAALDDGDALAELGGLDGGLLAARARADDEEVEVHGASLTPRSPLRARPPAAMRRRRCRARAARAPARRPGDARAGPEAGAQRGAAERSRGVAQLGLGVRGHDRQPQPRRALGHVGRQHGADVDALLERAVGDPQRQPRRRRSRARRCARRSPRPRSPRARARCAAAPRWPAASRPGAAARAAARAPPSPRRRRAGAGRWRSTASARGRRGSGRACGRRPRTRRRRRARSRASRRRRRPRARGRPPRPRRARPGRRRRAPCDSPTMTRTSWRCASADDLLERGAVAVEREHAVGHDQRRAAVGVAQPPGEVLDVAVVVEEGLRAREPAAVGDRGVAEAVGEHDLAALGERRDDPEVGEVAGAEQQRALACRGSPRSAPRAAGAASSCPRPSAARPRRRPSAWRRPPPPRAPAGGRPARGGCPSTAAARAYRRGPRAGPAARSPSACAVGCRAPRAPPAGPPRRACASRPCGCAEPTQRTRTGLARTPSGGAPPWRGRRRGGSAPRPPAAGRRAGSGWPRPRRSRRRVGVAAERVAERGQRRAVLRDERGLGRRRLAVALRRPRRRDRVRQALPEVDVVDERLQHGGDDRRAARRAERDRRAARA